MKRGLHGAALFTAVLTAAFLPVTVSAGAAEIISEQEEKILPYSEYDGISADMPNIIGARMFAEPGETVEFPVYIFQNPGYTASGVTLYYDSRLITVQDKRGRMIMEEGEAADDVLALFSSNYKKNCCGMASMLADSDTQEEDDGVLYYTSFQVPEDAERGTYYNMKIKILELHDKDGNEIEANPIDGWIMVGRPEDQTAVSAAKMSAKPGEAVEFPVFISQNPGYTASGITLDYDSRLITVQDEKGKLIMGQGEAADDVLVMFSNNYEKNCCGMASMLADSDTQETDDGMLFYASFQVPEDAAVGTRYDMKIRIRELHDQYGKEIAVRPVNGYIMVESPEDQTAVSAARMYANPGETVEFPVYISQNPGYTASGITLDYDSRLIPILNENGNLIMGQGEAADDVLVLFSDNFERYCCGMASMLAEPDIQEADDGVLFYASFQVPEDAVEGTCYDMKIRIRELHDQYGKEIAARPVNGCIMVGNPEEQTAVSAARMYANPGETVEFPVYISQNPGYTASGITLDYDSRLIPILNENGNLIMGQGEAADDVLVLFSNNFERYCCGMASMLAEPDIQEADDGVLFYASFQVPEDAVEGTCYDMKIRIRELHDKDGNEIAAAPIDGCIMIGNPEELTDEIPVQELSADLDLDGTAGTLPVFVRSHITACCAALAGLIGLIAVAASGILRSKKGRNQ